MKQIVLDTNFLMIPGTLKVDIFSELTRILDFKFEVCVLDSTIDEIKLIMASQRGKYKRAAKVGLDLIKAKDLKIIPTTQKQTDEALLGIASENCIIATQDMALKTLIKQKKAPVIILRQKKYLMVS